MWITLSRDGRRSGVEQVLPGLEALAQFTQELRGRLTVDGVDGVEGTVALYRRLKTALDGIPEVRLDEMRADVAALEEWALRVKHVLDEIVRLKAIVGR